MTEQTTELTTRAAITVQASQQRAFDVFTAGHASWWSPEHYIGEVQPETVVLESRQGGRWFERAPDGTECDRGRVLSYEPPGRLLLAWHLGPDFTYDPDPAKATEVEVRFISEGESRTRVELEHRGLEVHGEAAEGMRDALRSPGGWPDSLERFAAVVRST